MRGLLLALALVWVAIGVHGTFSYGNAYLTYRGFPPPKDPPGVTPGAVLHEHFHSAALGKRRSYVVYTPPGYAAAAARGQRFPVLYLLHGSPGDPMQFINVAHAGVDLDKGIEAHRLRPFLLAMPSGSDGSFRSETEWANTPHGRYETLVQEVVHSVDQRFATLHGRRYRAIGGNSEGGYAAINLSLHHPRLFSIAESWSGYLWQYRHGVFKHVPGSVIAANDPTLYAPTRAAQLRRHPLHAFIYKGSREPALVRNRAAAFANELRALGGRVTFRIFRGGHDWRIWRNQTPRMLAYADHWFGSRR